MANRICILDCCDDCPYFDNEYYGYAETCTKLSRQIKRSMGPFGSINNQARYEIPDDCPLEVALRGSSSHNKGCELCGSLFCRGNCFK